MHIRNDVHCTGCVHMFSIGRCQAYGYVQPMLFSLFPRADPVSGGYGSSSPPTQRTSRQHNMWCRIQLLMTLYVVLFPLPVMRRAGAENSDMIIFSAWYTSGKL